MKNAHDIIDDYLKMRRSNAAREEADMSLLKELNDQLQDALKTISEQEKIIQQQQQIIQEMKAARPVSIGTINGTYIETIQNAELCQPSSTSSTEPTLSTSIPLSNTRITPLNSPEA